ncbi:MAG: hypothetical protein ACLUUO_15510 [Sellimonas intestinalis]
MKVKRWITGIAAVMAAVCFEMLPVQGAEHVSALEASRKGFPYHGKEIRGRGRLRLFLPAEADRQKYLYLDRYKRSF